MPKRKLTKRVVDSLPIPADGGATGIMYYDTTLAGFGVRVFPSGRKRWFVEYGPEHRRRRMSLGGYPPLTVDQAREQATLLLTDILKGADPLEERRIVRQMPSFKEWADEYYAGVRLRKKRPKEDERYLRIARDHWGNKPLNSIGRRDVESTMRTVADRGHTTANRWLASVRACFQKAVDDGVIDTNPATKIKHFEQNPPRTRVLSGDEFKRLVTAVAGLEDQYARAAFLLLIETGARVSEVLQASWENLDLDHQMWKIPSPKAGKPQVVPLPRAIVVELRILPRVGPYVVVGRNPDKPRSDLKGPWAIIKKNSELAGITIHDLRRTFGLEVARRHGLHIASKLLRHSDVRITEQVYAPLGIEDLRKATDQISRARGRILRPSKSGARESGRGVAHAEKEEADA